MPCSQAHFELLLICLKCVQRERGAAETTLKDEIARLVADAQQRAATGASTTTKLDAAQREAAGHKRRLDEATAALDAERKMGLGLRTQVHQMQEAAEVQC